MGELFGTDGVRGLVGKVLTPELALALGRACSSVLVKSNTAAERPRIIIGKDTRISGDMLEAALIAGICSAGADVLTLGVIPTPAVAFLTREYKAACGVVISASHNPFYDNGIKFFGADGYKLSDELEAQIEELVLKNSPADYAKAADIGRVYELPEAKQRYVDFLIGSYEEAKPLNQLSVVVDCANGAAYQTAPALWQGLGAKVTILHDQPDGININESCGSTHLDSLREEVLRQAADLGIAYDGDADRCLAIDEKGNEVDGDQILTIYGLDLQHRGQLIPPQIVGTVMSNLGFYLTLQQAGITVHSSPVGDRYVIEQMKQTGALLGGESSGHVIFHNYSTTGDGLLTSLKLVEVMQRSRKPLSVLAQKMLKLPQVLVNVNISGKERIVQEPGYQEIIQSTREQLGDEERLLVRASGTEPLIRIFAQGSDLEKLQKITGNIKRYIEEYHP